MYPCFSCWPSARCCPCWWKGNWPTKNWSCFSSESCSSSHFLWAKHSPAANHTRSQTKQVQCEPLHSKNEDTTCRSRTVQHAESSTTSAKPALIVILWSSLLIFQVLPSTMLTLISVTTLTAPTKWGPACSNRGMTYLVLDAKSKLKYFYATCTSKVDVNLPGSTLTRECQLCDLIVRLTISLCLYVPTPSYTSCQWVLIIIIVQELGKETTSTTCNKFMNDLQSNSQPAKRVEHYPVDRHLKKNKYTA